MDANCAEDALAPRHVLVIGLGDLGGTLAAALAAGGARVTGVRRGADAPAGVTLVRGDAADPDVLAAVPDDVEFAVLCLTPDTYDEPGYRRGYLAPAEAFARRFAGAGLRRVLWVSSTAVHAQGDGARIDESAPAEPDGFRGRVLLEAEAALAGAGAPVTAVRLSGLYGPGRTALIRRVLSGRGAAQTPVHYTNRIHRDDAVGVLAFLLARAARGAALPSVVLGTDPNPSPRHEVLQWLAARLGVALQVPAAPDVDRAPSRRLQPAGLVSMGYRWTYPDYRAGFEAVIAEMEASGALADLRAAITDA